MMSIVKATDVARLHALNTALGYTKDEGYFEQCLADQKAGTRDVLIVVSQDGADMGYGMLNYTPRYSLYARLGIPEIQDVNVLRSMRRLGAASALINHCEELARARGCTDIGISVGLSREYGAAQRLYALRGYVPDGNGVTYDRRPIDHGVPVLLDDDLCLMLVKTL